MVAVKLVFADGDTCRVDARDHETVLAATRRAGFQIATDCEIGDCQTCRAEIQSGEIDFDESCSHSLSDEELAAGATLCCVGIPRSDVTLRLPYSRAGLIPQKTLQARMESLARLSPSTIRLRLRVNGPGSLSFNPGQYVNLGIPGSEQSRSFSMANSPGDPTVLEFLVRLLPEGVMSEYLRERARPGDLIELRGPRGVFYLRRNERRKLMIAGGTGLAPMLSMLRTMIDEGATATPVVLCFGVTGQSDLFCMDELQELTARFPLLDVRTAIAHPDPAWNGVRGFVTDLLRPSDTESDTEVYLCGPPPMIGAARAWLSARDFPSAQIYAEEFVPS